MAYTRKNYTGDRPPNYGLAHILATPPKPYCLSSVSARSILGEVEFKRVSRRVRERVSHHCEVCGRYVKFQDNDWFHYFDFCRIDYQAKVFHFEGIYALCDECYYYVNRSPLFYKLKELEVNRKYVDNVISKGDTMLSSVGLSSPYPAFDRKGVYVYDFQGTWYINDFYPKIALRGIKRGYAS